MSIVLDEYIWAEQAIHDRELGKNPSETLNRISKYYAAQNYSRRDVRHMLDIFMVQCDPRVSLALWSDKLDRIADNCKKNPPIKIDKIPITQLEIAKINELRKKQLRRLAFVLLCVAKYWDRVSDKNNHWVNTSDKEIMSMANINTSIERQSSLFAELRDAGLIKFSKKIDNLNVQVLFIEEDTQLVAMNISDFRNLGYQYMMYCGEPYFACSHCGLVTKLRDPSKGRTQKYCSDCASEVSAQQRIDSVMRKRNILKS